MYDVINYLFNKKKIDFNERDFNSTHYEKNN